MALIDKNAPADKIVRDLEMTLSFAGARGSPFQEEAERLLRPSVLAAAALRLRLGPAEAAVDSARLVLDYEDGVTARLVASHKDVLYNAFGRPRHDPVLDRIFPDGSKGYSRAPAAQRAPMLLRVAAALRGTADPRIPRHVVETMALDLEQAAARLSKLQEQRAVALSEWKRLREQFRAAADEGRESLARLKLCWRAQGLSETEVHRIIPSRRRRRAPRAEAPALTLVGSGDAPEAGGE